MSNSRSIIVRDTSAADKVSGCLPDLPSQPAKGAFGKDNSCYLDDDPPMRNAAAHFKRCVEYIDLMHSPKEAESIIGDLREQFQVRVRADPNHAIRWIWSQTARLGFDVLTGALSKLVAACKGKKNVQNTASDVS
jgi:hypothetical protein